MHRTFARGGGSMGLFSNWCLLKLGPCHPIETGIWAPMFLNDYMSIGWFPGP